MTRIYVKWDANYGNVSRLLRRTFPGAEVMPDRRTGDTTARRHERRRVPPESWNEAGFVVETASALPDDTLETEPGFFGRLAERLWVR